MYISYRDNIGLVVEMVDEYGVTFVDGIVYFNDKQIDINAIVSIMREA